MEHEHDGSFDDSLIRSINARAEARRENDRRIIERRLARERRAEQLDQEATDAEEAQSQEVAKEPPSAGDAPDEEPGIVSNIFAGIGAGFRDAGVNVAQTVLDVGAFATGLEAPDLDKAVPDFEDRDSTAFNISKTGTQFLSLFVPALGAVRFLSGMSKVRAVMAASRTSKFGRALTSIHPSKGVQLGMVAEGALAGIPADFAAFDPFEARFSDMLVDIGVDNPVTQFLKSDEDDSALEGRFKQTLEGLGLGLVADGIFRGVVRIRQNKKAYAGTIVDDQPTDAALGIKHAHDDVTFNRSNVEELETIVESWDNAAARVGDPTVAEARAKLSDPTLEISGDAQAFITGAERRGIDFEDSVRELDTAANAQSPIEVIRANDPETAAKLDARMGVSRDSLQTELDEAVHELALAENNLIDVRHTADYANLSKRDRKIYEEIDKYVPPRARKSIEAAQAERPGMVENSPHKNIPDPKDPAAETVILKGDDGVETIDMAALSRHLSARAETPKQRALTRIIDQDFQLQEAIRVALVRTRDGELDYELLGQVIGLNNMNIRMIAGSEADKQLADELATIVRTVSKRKLRGRQAVTQTREVGLKHARVMAEELGDPSRVDEILDNYTRHFQDNIEDFAAQMDAHRIMTEATRWEMNKLAMMVSNGGGHTVTKARMLMAVKKYTRFQDIRDGYATAAGRTLRQMQEVVGAIPLPTRDIDGAFARGGNLAQELIDAAGGGDAVEQLARDLVGQKTAGLERALRQAGKGKILKMVQEYWLNSILSGPITHAVNNFSNALINIYKPGEMWIDGFRAQDPAIMGQALAQYRALAQGYRAAFTINAHGFGEVVGSVLEQLAGKPGALETAKFRMAKLGTDTGSAWKAFATGESSFQGARAYDFDEINAITSSNINKIVSSRSGTNIKALKPGTTGAMFVDGGGEVIRLPGRFLGAADEAAKAINYHMVLSGLAHRRALGMEGILEENIQRIVQDVPSWRTNPLLDDRLRSIYEEMHANAQMQARVNAFTDPLARGSVGKSVQDGIVKHPLARFMVPFVRTPINLLKFAGERTPIVNRFTKTYKDAVEAAVDKSGKKIMTPELHAAKTRLMIGTGLYMLAGTAAYNGLLTGAGPGSGPERSALLATGWQPYSIRIQNDDGSHTFISYNRTDPIGLFLGVAATIAETIGMMDDLEMTELMTAGAVAVAETLKSKSYFTGLTAVVAAMEQPDRRFGSWAERTAGSFVPNLLAQLNQQAGNDAMREVDGLLQAIRARIPGLSVDLPPRRNIFGEVITYAHGLGPDTISPFFTRTQANTLVNREIERLSRRGSDPFGANMHVYDTIGDIELTPEQRDRFIVLSSGDPSRNGSDLRDGLTKLMKTARYRNSDDSREGRQALIRDFFAKRRKRGRREMLKRDTDLNQQVREARRQRASAQRSPRPQQPAGTSIVDQLTNSLASSTKFS